MLMVDVCVVIVVLGLLWCMLLFYFGVLLVVFVVVLLFVVCDYGQCVVNCFYDYLLVFLVLFIVDLVVLVDGQWQVDLLYVVLDLLVMVFEDCVFYCVVDSRGILIIGYGDLLVLLCWFGIQLQLFDVIYSGEIVCFVVVSCSFVVVLVQGEVQVQVGQIWCVCEVVVQDMVNCVLLVIGVLFGLLLVLVVFGVYCVFWLLVWVECELL